MHCQQTTKHTPAVYLLLSTFFYFILSIVWKKSQNICFVRGILPELYGRVVVTCIYTYILSVDNLSATFRYTYSMCCCCCCTRVSYTKLCKMFYFKSIFCVLVTLFHFLFLQTFHRSRFFQSSIHGCECICISFYCYVIASCKDNAFANQFIEWVREKKNEKLYPEVYSIGCSFS